MYIICSVFVCLFIFQVFGLHVILNFGSLKGTLLCFSRSKMCEQSGVHTVTSGQIIGQISRLLMVLQIILPDFPVM